MGATGTGIALGTALGSFVPGIGNVVGAAVGGVIGAGIDIFNWFSGQKGKNDQARLDYEQATAENQARLTELQTRAGAYQDFLSKVPVAGQELKGTTGDVEFDAQYRALVENYGNVNVMAGVTGRVAAGSTGAAVGQQAQDVMSGFVTAEKQRAEQQLAIYQAGIQATDRGQAAADEARRSALWMLPPSERARQTAHPGGVKGAQVTRSAITAGIG